MEGVPRRAFIFMPFVFGGWMALWVMPRRERSLPDAARNGNGPAVTLALFTNGGQRKGTIKVDKIVKSDAEWRKELKSDESAVTRKKGTGTGSLSLADIGTITRPAFTAHSVQRHGAIPAPMKSSIPAPDDAEFHRKRPPHYENIETEIDSTQLLR